MKLSAPSYWIMFVCFQDAAAEDVTVLLLGNKNDHPKRCVTTQEGETLAKVWLCGIFESRICTRVIQIIKRFSKIRRFTSTGERLWIHGVQRCHWRKCDPVFGNFGQVTRYTTFYFSYAVTFNVLCCNTASHSHISFCCLSLSGCWGKKLTQERKPQCCPKSPRRRNQDVAK